LGRLTLLFGVCGLVCTTILLASPVVAIPIVALAAALVMPRLAAIAMCVWCSLSFVGFLMAPCAIGMVASARERA
jgi:hypothetical protein